MADKSITVEGVEPLLLFGFNDQYLRKVEAAFPETRVVARGNQVHLRGADADVARIERVLAELALVLHRNGNLTENDVETVLAIEAGPSEARGDAADAILFTPAGGTVKARTPGQVQLVEAARRHDIVFAIGPAGTGKCVAADTLVLTDRGMLPIGRLVEGTRPGDHPPLACTVHGLDGPEAASHFYDGGEAATLRVTTRRGFSIEATPEHPLLVLAEDGALAWRRADALRPGDVVALQRGQRLFGSTEHVRFRAGRAGAVEDAEERLDPELAYFAGLVVGDGCLTPPRSVLVSTADPEVVAALERTAARFGRRVRRNGRQRPHDYAIHSTALRALLLALGCTAGRAREKRVPATVLRAPEPVVVAFLQGLFDADGSVERRDGAVTLSTVSERLAHEVQVVLLNLGVVASRSVKRGRYAGRPHRSHLLTIAGAEAARFHERVGFRLARKRALRPPPGPSNPNLDVVPHVAGLLDAAVRLVTLSRAQHRALYDYRTGRRRPSYAKLAALVGGLHDAGAAGPALAGLREIVGRRLLFLEVERVEPGRARVFDLTVPGTHSFVAGGFVNHNTWTAVALAVSALKSRQVKKIVLCRPAVEAGESLGFLPGGLRDKVDPYLRPLYDALEEMMGLEKLRASLDANTVEIVPLAYMRGRTLLQAFVILDEAQNATAAQMKMFLTRLGAGSRSIVTGDVTQTDLPSRTLSGLVQARGILEGIEGIAFIDFDKGDVVRHRLVKDIIEAYEKADDGDGRGDGAMG